MTCQVRETSVFDNSAPFLIVGECIEEKCYVLSLIAGMCDALVVLLHMCHSWRRHVLETWCVGE